MGGWLVFMGAPNDAEARVDRFRRVFAVAGVPPLRTKLHHTTSGIAVLLWGWSNREIPDVHYTIDEAGRHAVMCGVITGVDGQQLRDMSQTAIAKRLLGAWARGDLAIEAINGSFSFVLHDPASSRTAIVVDRFASRSVWTSVDGPHVIAGNFVSSIAAAKHEAPVLDAAGVWSLFTASRPAGVKSLYRGIVAMLAGRQIDVDRDTRVRESTWWKRKYDYNLLPNRREWGEAIAATLTGAARRYHRVCRDPHLFLSGGLDSRVVAGAFGKPVRTLSLCTNPNAETKLGSAVARVLGLEHETVVRSRHWYLDTLDASALTSGGSYFTAHAHFMRPVVDVLERRPEAEFILGDLTESFNKHYFRLPDFPVDITDGIQLRAFLRANSPYFLPGHRPLGAMLQPYVRDRAEAEHLDALTYLSKQVAAVSDDYRDRLDTLLRWVMISVTPTFHMFTCMWPLAPERNICLDNDVDALARSIPPSLRGTEQLHPFTLRALSMSLSLIPNANTFLPPFMPRTVGKVAKRVRPVLGYLRRLPHRFAPRGPALETSGSWLLNGELYRKDPKYQHAIEQTLLDDHLFPEDVFDRREIRDIWTRFLGGESAKVFEIDALITFGALSRLIAPSGIAL